MMLRIWPVMPLAGLRSVAHSDSAANAAAPARNQGDFAFELHS